MPHCRKYTTRIRPRRPTYIIYLHRNLRKFKNEQKIVNRKT